MSVESAVPLLSTFNIFVTSELQMSTNVFPLVSIVSNGSYLKIGQYFLSARHVLAAKFLSFVSFSVFLKFSSCFQHAQSLTFKSIGALSKIEHTAQLLYLFSITILILSATRRLN